jgi:mannose/fructose/N-acetylgalactosamine-specific phosphotransferase system component IIC
MVKLSFVIGAIVIAGVAGFAIGGVLGDSNMGIIVGGVTGGLFASFMLGKAS